MLDFIWHGPLKTVSDGWQILHSQMASRFQKMTCYIQVQKTDYSQYNSEDFRVSHLFPLKSLFILYLPAVMLMFILLRGIHEVHYHVEQPKTSAIWLYPSKAGFQTSYNWVIETQFLQLLVYFFKTKSMLLHRKRIFLGFLYVFPENIMQNQMQMLLSSEGRETPQNQLTLKHLLSM